jgi:hypothetical protein
MRITPRFRFINFVTATVRNDIRRQIMRDKPHVFLCHSHADKPFVRRIAKELDELNVDVWLDEWELEIGDSLHDCIGSAIEASAYIAVTLSPHSVKSKWCRSELQAALAKEMELNRKLVLPILRERVKVPPFLADRLYLDFRGNHFMALAHLAALIYRITPKDMLQALQGTKPKSLQDVKAALEDTGWTGCQEIDAEDYDKIKRILGRHGISLSGDEFAFIPIPTEKRRPKKKPRRTLIRR